MPVMGELNPKGLPRQIPADELQAMLGPNQGFCSWDASISKVSESMARWPFLLLGHRYRANNLVKRRVAHQF
jgi:hypothetical protein